jgi:hypothetical protein
MAGRRASISSSSRVAIALHAAMLEIVPRTLRVGKGAERTRRSRFNCRTQSAQSNNLHRIRRGVYNPFTTN